MRGLDGEWVILFNVIFSLLGLERLEYHDIKDIIYVYWICTGTLDQGHYTIATILPCIRLDNQLVVMSLWMRTSSYLALALILILANVSFLQVYAACSPYLFCIIFYLYFDSDLDSQHHIKVCASTKVLCNWLELLMCNSWCTLSLNYLSAQIT